MAISAPDTLPQSPAQTRRPRRRLRAARPLVLIFGVTAMASVSALWTLPADCPWQLAFLLLVVPGLITLLAITWLFLLWRDTRTNEPGREGARMRWAATAQRILLQQSERVAPIQRLATGLADRLPLTKQRPITDPGSIAEPGAEEPKPGPQPAESATRQGQPAKKEVASPLTTPWQRVAFYTSIIALLAGFVAYFALDNTLLAFHQPGSAAFGLREVTGFFVAGEHRSRILAEALVGWHEHLYSVNAPVLYGDAEAPVTVLRWALLVDSIVIVPAYGLCLALLILWTWRAVTLHYYGGLDTSVYRYALPASSRQWLKGRLGKRGRLLRRPILWLMTYVHDLRGIGAGDDAGRLYTVKKSLRTLGQLALAAILIGALADWAENALAFQILNSGWQMLPAQQALNPEQAASAAKALAQGQLPGAWWLTVVVWIKWIALVLAVAYPLYAILALLRDRGGTAIAAGRASDVTDPRTVTRDILSGLCAARVPLLGVLLFVAIIYQEQIQEIARRWGDPNRRGIGVWSGFLALLLGYAVAICAWSAMRAWWAASLGPSTKSWRRPLLLIGVVGCGLAILAAIYGTLFPLAPFGLVVAGITLLSAPVSAFRGKDRQTRQAPPGRDDGQSPGDSEETIVHTALPGLLGGAVPLILGLTTLYALVELLTYQRVRTGENVDTPQTRTLAAVVVFYLVCGCILFGRGLPRWIRELLGGRRITAPWRTAPHWAGGVMAVVLVVWGGLAGMLHDEAWLIGFSTGISLVGVLCLGFLLVVVLLTCLGILGDWIFVNPPAIFRIAGLRRMPVLSLLLVWALLAGYLPYGQDIHQLRLEDLPAAASPLADVDPQATPQLRTGISLQAAFVEWTRRRCLDRRSPPAAPQSSSTPKPVVPLILVATSGGGIRAATWTTYVLDDLLGYDPGLPMSLCTPEASLPARLGGPLGRYRSDWVFAASGVSGGSVGLATYLTRLTRSDQQQIPARNTTDPWVRRQLGADLISPSVAWMLFVELPWTFVRVGVTQDRAGVMERSWETAVDFPAGQPGLFRQYELAHPSVPSPRPSLPPATSRDRQAPDVPILLLNATSVESGCRFVGTVLEVNRRESNEPVERCLAPAGLVTDTKGVLGGTNDLADFVCRSQDIRLSTLAFVSARFPIISPSGDLAQCELEDRPRTFLVDGGYLEGSGTATIVGLWSMLAPYVAEHNQDPDVSAYIVPVLIHIDNGYAEPAPPSADQRPMQLVAPAITFGAVRSGNEAMVRQQAQLIFSPLTGLPMPEEVTCGKFPTSRYAYFPLRAHPGPSAKLGWTLSDVAFGDLISQYGQLNPTDPSTGRPKPGTPARLLDDWFADLAGRCD